MINRWLSMHYDLIEIIDMFQQYTIGPLDKKHVYQLYFDILPRQKMYVKYIKGTKADKFNKELIAFIATHYQTSNREAEDHVTYWTSSMSGLEHLRDLLKRYGKTDSEIKKLLK